MDSVNFDTPSAIARLGSKPVAMSSAIVERQTSRFYSTGSSVYGGNNKQINIKMSSTSYIDPKTMTFNFLLKCGKNVVPESDLGLAIINQATLYVNGAKVSQVDDCSGFLRNLFYINNDSSVVTGPIGTAGGHYRFKTARSTYVNNNDTTIAPVNISATTTYKNFDQGPAQQPNGDGSGSTIFQNPSAITTSCGHINIPEAALWTRQTFLSDGTNNRLLSGYGASKDGRFYSIRCMDIFPGFFGNDQYLPLRNMGNIEIILCLVPNFGQAFLTVPNFTTPANSNAIAHDALVDNNQLASNVQFYELIAPYISVDVVKVNQTLEAMLDQQCAGPEGFGMVFSAWAVSLLSAQYSTNIQLTSSRTFSHVRDSLIFARDTRSLASPFLNSADTYLGTKHRSHRITVGGSSFPLVECDSLSGSLLEVQKMTADLGRTDGGNIIDLNTYAGANPYSQLAGRGYYPNLALNTINGNDNDAKACLLQSASLWASPLSNFCIAQSFEKYISKSKILSGINTKLSSANITLALSLQPLSPVDPSTSYASTLQPYSMDCILGKDLSFHFGVHYEALLLIQNNSVIVQE
jgi:hypothetical protein